MKDIKSPLSMIFAQILTVGMFLLLKLVLNRGMFVFALLAYRNLVGALFVAPFAFFFEREMLWKINMKVVLWTSISGLLGITVGMGLQNYGLKDTTAAFSSNFLNLIPIATFFFAAIAGMEKLGLGSKGGRTKLTGTVICVAGAMVITLYKGKVLHIWPTHMILHHESTKNVTLIKHHWLRGSLLLVGSCISYASWFLVQVKLFKVFPAKYWSTVFTCLAGCFQTFVIGIILDHSIETWRLKFDMQLFTIVFSGVFNTGVTFCLITWVISRKGPSYPPMFNALSVLFITFLESFFMGQDITVGSFLGMMFIIGGLYAFLWGKAKESSVQRAKVGDISTVSDSKQSQPLSMDKVVITITDAKS